MRSLLRDRRKRFFKVEPEIFNLGLRPVAGWVYCFLASMANRLDDTCFPSYRYIAKALGIGERTAMGAVADLVAVRAIKKQLTTGDDGRCRHNIYELMDLPVQPPSQCKPKRGKRGCNSCTGTGAENDTLTICSKERETAKDPPPKAAAVSESEAKDKSPNKDQSYDDVLAGEIHRSWRLAFPQTPLRDSLARRFLKYSYQRGVSPAWAIRYAATHRAADPIAYVLEILRPGSSIMPDEGGVTYAKWEWDVLDAARRSGWRVPGRSGPDLQALVSGLLRGRPMT